MNSFVPMNTPGSAAQTVETVGKNSLPRIFGTGERHTSAKQEISRTRLVGATLQRFSTLEHYPESSIQYQSSIILYISL